MLHTLCTLLLVGGLASGVSAQIIDSLPPQLRIISHNLGLLTEHLTLDGQQTDCLTAAGVDYFERYGRRPARTKEQLRERATLLRQTTLKCLNPEQRQRIRTVVPERPGPSSERNLLEVYVAAYLRPGKSPNPH